MIFGFNFLCCCSKERKEELDGGGNLFGSDSRLKNLNRIMIEFILLIFITEESKLGMREVPFFTMVEKILLESSKGAIPKKDVVALYKSTALIDADTIKDFLVQDFFFTDNTRSKYDFNKLVIFNILYTGGDDKEKGGFLFNLMENTTSSCINNHSQKLITTMEHLLYIPTITIGEILNAKKRFQSDQEDREFQELLALYSTNSNMLREFSLLIIGTHLFPESQERQYLTRSDLIQIIFLSDFMKRLDECKYVLFKPNELRKRYTEYVLQNHTRAMLPSRTLMRQSNKCKVRQTIRSTRGGLLESTLGAPQRMVSEQLPAEESKGTYNKAQTSIKKTHLSHAQRNKGIEAVPKLKLPLAGPYGGEYSNFPFGKAEKTFKSYRNEATNRSMFSRRDDKSDMASFLAGSPKNKDDYSPLRDDGLSGGFPAFNPYQDQDDEFDSRPSKQQAQSKQQPMLSYNTEMSSIEGDYAGKGVGSLTKTKKKQYIAPSSELDLSDQDLEQQLQRLNIFISLNMNPSYGLPKSSNQVLLRESSLHDTQTSFTFKKYIIFYPTSKAYLKELFGEPFTTFVQERVKVEEFSQKRQNGVKQSNIF